MTDHLTLRGTNMTETTRSAASPNKRLRVYPVASPAAAAALLLWFTQALAYSSGKRETPPNHKLLIEAIPDGSPIAQVSGPLSDEHGTYFKVALRRSKLDLNADPSLSEYRSSIEVDPIGLATWMLMLALGGGSSLKRSTKRDGADRKDYVDVFSGDDRVSLRRILFDADEGGFAFEGEDRLDYRLKSAGRLQIGDHAPKVSGRGRRPERGREHVFEVIEKLWGRNTAKLKFAISLDDWKRSIQLAFKLVDEERSAYGTPQVPAAE